MANGTNLSLLNARHFKVDPVYHPGRANHRRPGQTSSPAVTPAPGKPAGNFADALKLAQQRLRVSGGVETTEKV